MLAIMTAAEVLAELRNNGITLEATGGQLRFFPQEGVPERALTLMREYKAELLALLAPCLACGGTDWRRVKGPWRCAAGGQHSIKIPCHYRREPSRLACRTCEPLAPVAVEAEPMQAVVPSADTAPVQLTMMAAPPPAQEGSNR